MRGKTSRLYLMGSLVAVACAAWVGCDARNSDKKDGSDKKKSSAAAEEIVEPLLQGWSQPAFALMLSGEQHGYLEPCGCSETQSGGVARRHDLVRQIEERGWEVIGLDMGGVLKRHNYQSKVKFDAILKALRGMDYRALGLGPEELNLGVLELIQQHIPDSPEGEGLPFVSANLTFLGDPEVGTPIRFVVTEVAGKKVGVTSIVTEDNLREVPELQSPELLKVDPPAEALAPVVEQLRAAECDLLVLLSYAEVDESRELAQKFPEFQLILSAGGPEDPRREPMSEGDTMIINVGGKGKYVGVVGFYPDAEQPLKFELVDLDNRRFENSPVMVDVMRDYQTRLREERVVENASEFEISHSTGYSYVGVAKCAECHKKAYAVWKDSKHAHAYETLEIGRKGQEANWVPRIHDPECLACHTTGWDSEHVLRYRSGFVTAELTPHLKGQQCENCHGPGSRHTELEEQWAADRKSVDNETLLDGRREVKLSQSVAAKTVCIRCHDLENSPKFDFEKYFEKVKHVGRD